MNYHFSNKIASLKPSAIREILKMSADPSVIPLAAGNPAPEAFPVEQVERITTEILQKNPILALQYSVTEGYPQLRERLREFARQRYDAYHENDDLIVTSGAQQAIELTCKVLCDEGDVVLCEDPSFIGSLNSFRSYNVQLKGVPMQEDGIDIEALSKILETTPRVRFIYTIPNFQNPTGVTMSLEKRRALYALARLHDIIILEDNPYGELRFSGEALPTLKSMDADDRVVYVGSFSKILSPGMRVGFVSAHRELIAKITVAKQCSDVHSNILAQLICERFLAETDMDAHVARLQNIYRHKSGLMLTAMAETFSSKVSYQKPQGGLFIWCTLPEGSDVPALAKLAIEKHRVAIVPGVAFSIVEGAPSPSFRLNYSSCTDERVVQGTRLLGELTRELYGD